MYYNAEKPDGEDMSNYILDDVGPRHIVFFQAYILILPNSKELKMVLVDRLPAGTHLTV